MGAVVAGEGNRPGSANTVDNLGPNLLNPSPAFSPWMLSAHRSRLAAGSTEAHLSQAPPTMLPVEKSGPDFHRLAAPARPKSPIRSIPKYGSGAIRSTHRQMWPLVRLD
jgi:hypothetical protein